MPDKSTKEMTAQEAQKKAEATEAELLQVLNRGAVTDRLDVKDADPERHYEWVRDEESSISRWEALNFVIDTEDGKNPTGLHGTGDNRIRVGDVIRMSCTMDNYRLLEKLKAQRKARRAKMDAKKEYLTQSRRENPSVPVLDPLNVGGDGGLEMPFYTQPGKTKGSGGNVPDVTELDAGTITCNKGRVVTNTAGAAVLHGLGATVTGIYGITLEGAAAGVTDGPGTLLAIAKADRNTVFVSKVVSSAAILTDLSALTVGDQYGMILLSGHDYIDYDDTTNVVAQITKIDDDLNVVWFQFLESTIQEPNG